MIVEAPDQSTDATGCCTPYSCFDLVLHFSIILHHTDLLRPKQQNWSLTSWRGSVWFLVAGGFLSSSFPFVFHRVPQLLCNQLLKHLIMHYLTASTYWFFSPLASIQYIYFFFLVVDDGWSAVGPSCTQSAPFGSSTTVAAGKKNSLLCTPTGSLIPMG